MAFAAAGHRARDLVRGPALTDAPSARAPRKIYLDWLRGVAVIVMVGAHVTDAWTRNADRHSSLYLYTIFVAGLAAPLFLFLAGLSTSMSASARAESVGHSAAASLALRRGVQIFSLAFLFRLQSQLLGWGALGNFLKVDILNVMGLAMIGAAAIWSASRSRTLRIIAFATATAAVAMITPLVREAGVIAVLPDPIEAYIRPLPGRTSFAIFPWSGFLIAGAIAGEMTHAARGRAAERRLQAGFLVAGLGGIAVVYAASFRPSIYPVANFWTSSPTFFFIRLGICAVMIPIAFAVDRFHALVRSVRRDWLSSPDAPGVVITTLGRASLFVYWIHVEMVYGVIGRPLRRALPLEAALLATVILCGILYAIVRWRDRVMANITLTGPLRILTPVLRS